MRALVQRVAEASVTVVSGSGSEVVGSIGPGLLALVGITHSDTPQLAARLAAKIWNLRVLDDDSGVMNRSLADVSSSGGTGSVLVVSQFTLYGDTTAGRRPSWIAAARPEVAEPLVRAVVDELVRLGADVQTGRFRTDMRVALVNDGPVTVSIEI
jgi:D-tyrosyl-tRNA(Tyr) deacylase